MPDFRKLFEEVLTRRPDLDEASLTKLIEVKKARVGAGYLTSQGALFLVAADLGVQLEHVVSSDLTLKDLYVGAGEITVVARILSIYPSKIYSKKKGGEGIYRRLVLFDGESTVKLTLWEEKAKLVEDLKLKVGVPVRIVKGYVKAGLDGRPALSVGVKGNIELIEDKKILKELPSVEAISKDISEIVQPGQHLSVIGTVRLQPKLSKFGRRDGTEGSLIQLSFGSLTSEKEVRVALWDKEDKDVLELPVNSTVKIINVRAKAITRGGVEFHGDAGTTVEVIPRESVTKTRPTKVFRLVSRGLTKSLGSSIPSIITLLTDETGTIYTLYAEGGAHKKIEGVTIDSVLEISMYFEKGNTNLTCESESSILIGEDRGSNCPDFHGLAKKVSTLKDANQPVFLEAIALSKSSAYDVTTRDNSVVKKADLTVGDETGEIKVIAWRDATEVLEGIVPGERLKLRGLTMQTGKDGVTQLQVRPYSMVERVATKR